jgi:trk system potassium uptake protein
LRQTQQTETTGKLTFRMPRVRLPRIPFMNVTRASNPFSLTLSFIYGFGALILLGAIILVLPFSSNSGNFTSPLNALFTSASAVCVTGLVVVDTGNYWSGFGQGVLLALFQIGGLGFITGVTLLLLGINRKFGLRDRLVISETMGVDKLGGTLGIVAKLACFSLIVEAAGAISFYVHGLASGPTGISVWASIFHAVSSFNNCGMDIFGDFKSVSGFQGDTLFLLITALLVIIGSTGYAVIADMFGKWKFVRLNLDSKIVLTTTLALLLLGSLLIFGIEYSNPASLGPLSFTQKISVAFFQSAAPRTAGFSAIDIGILRQITLFIIMFLMFIGGAVGSTAGGVKVNTLGVLIITLISVLRGKSSIEAFYKQLSNEIVFRAIALWIIYLTTAAIIVFVLSCTENFPIDKIIFETFSALSTVGLTTGITPDLSVLGKILIIFSMFVGRLGPLFFIAFLSHHHSPGDIEYPHENIRIG